MKQTAENVPCGMDTVRSVPLAPAQAQRPVLIVFDLDGTIADSQELARISFKRVFALMGSGEISDELADSFNGPDADEVCRVMGIGPDRRPLYDMLVDQTDVELVRTVGRMFPGTGHMLDALAPHAVLAILTNGSRRYCEACISEFAISPYISLHSGFVSGVSKAQRMRMWAQELGVRRVIAVGDRATDIANARAAGAVAVAVTYGMGTREELRDADCLCGTTDELAARCLSLIAAP